MASTKRTTNIARARCLAVQEQFQLQNCALTPAFRRDKLQSNCSLHTFFQRSVILIFLFDHM